MTRYIRKKSPGLEQLNSSFPYGRGGKDRFNFFLVLQLLSMEICQRTLSSVPTSFRIHLRGGVPFSFAGAKVRQSIQPAKYSGKFFQKKCEFSCHRTLLAGKLGRDTLLYITRARHEIHDARGKGAKRAGDSSEMQGKKICAAEKIIPRSKEKGFHGQGKDVKRPKKTNPPLLLLSLNTFRFENRIFAT